MCATVFPAARIAELTRLGVTIGALKGVVRRAALMVSNDTGPRHIAAAFGVPAVALFGPTDPRWTALPDAGPDGVGSAGAAREIVIAADPSTPPDEIADDHPERCRIERISSERVAAAVDRLLLPRSGACGMKPRVAGPRITGL